MLNVNIIIKYWLYSVTINVNLTWSNTVLRIRLWCWRHYHLIQVLMKVTNVISLPYPFIADFFSSSFPLFISKNTWRYHFFSPPTTFSDFARFKKSNSTFFKFLILHIGKQAHESHKVLEIGYDDEWTVRTCPGFFLC